MTTESIAYAFTDLVSPPVFPSRSIVMMKAAFLLSALAIASGPALAAPSATVHNQSQPETLTLNSSASSFGTVAAVPAMSAASNPNVPGATGRTVVLGDHSTIAGDRAATMYFRDGAY
jgi:hypothetical protein